MVKIINFIATLLLLLTLMVACNTKGKDVLKVAAQPNIIYINVDDLSWKDDGRDPLFRTCPAQLYKNWKLHHYFGENALELYDLENDLGERNNLVGSYPDKAKELYDLLDS